jgi:GntR family transcriptional regulator
MDANAIAVQLATSYLPLDLAEGTALVGSDPSPRGIYSRLADLGQAPATFIETICVRPRDKDEAQFLRMEPD